MFNLRNITYKYQHAMVGIKKPKVGKKLPKSLVNCWQKNVDPTSPKGWANVTPTLAEG